MSAKVQEDNNKFWDVISENQNTRRDRLAGAVPEVGILYGSAAKYILHTLLTNLDTQFFSTREIWSHSICSSHVKIQHKS